MNSLAEGIEVHSHIMRTAWFRPSRMLVNTIIQMYAQCGSLLDARKLFDDMQQRDANTWTVMLIENAKHGAPADTLEIYQRT
jgi:pentatricopeptide repeat protein